MVFPVKRISIFLVFFQRLQVDFPDSELRGLRRPSGYPIHDRRTSAPFPNRTEGALRLVVDELGDDAN